ncbi:MAG: hypothetical protein ABI123_04080 [Ginsengibacter sp.]
MTNHHLYIIFIALLLVVSSCNNKNDDKIIPSLHETYRKNDALPFGSRVAFDQIDSTFIGAKIVINYSNFTELSPIKMKGNLNRDNSIYFLLTRNLVLNESEVQDMINFVISGNDLFISADYIDSKLLEKIYLTMNRGPETVTEIKDIMRNTHLTMKNFTNLADLKDTFNYYYYPFLNYFSNYDEDNTKVWGYNEKGLPDFVQIKMKSGNFYIQAAPRSFSNYFLLTNGNKQYLANVLRILRQNPSVVYWDEYYKNMTPLQNKNKLKGNETDGDSFSALHVVQKNPTLLMAFWVTVIGILLFVLINVKRKQRLIPKISANTNSTVAFTETIGKLYFQHKNNKRIAEKMITYFYENMRNTYFLKAEMSNKDLINSLAGKTGIAADLVQKLIENIHDIRMKDEITDEELLRLNQQIELFNKNKNDRRKY